MQKRTTYSILIQLVLPRGFFFKSMEKKVNVCTIKSRGVFIQHPICLPEYR